MTKLQPEGSKEQMGLNSQQEAEALSCTYVAHEDRGVLSLPSFCPGLYDQDSEDKVPKKLRERSSLAGGNRGCSVERRNYVHG